jgi:hypothetical protein
MRRTLLAVLVLLVVLPAGARAATYSAVSTFPTADQDGLSAAVGAGFAVCGAGQAGAGCRTPGALSAGSVRGVAMPAFAAGEVIFTAPAGTTIAGGEAVVRYRTATAGIHARLLYRRTGAWIVSVLPDAPTATRTATVPFPAGVAQVALSLYARTAVAATAVASAGADSLVVASLTVALNDDVAPTAAVTGGMLDDAQWHRGPACVDASATDVGLGVHDLRLAVDGSSASLAGAVGTRLAPRPAHLAGTICLDTTTVHDGYLTAAVSAGDGVDDAGNRSSAVLGSLRVDNTAPAVTPLTPAETEDRNPTLAIRAVDGTSGIAVAAATLDDAPLALTPAGETLAATPSTPLAFGRHLLVWRVVDAAGNVASGSTAVAVVDRTAPVIAEPSPADGATASVGEPISFTVRDDGSGLADGGLAVSLDGRDVDASGELVAGVFTYRVGTLAAGVHRVTVRVVDRAGNVANSAWSFRIDAPVAQQPTLALDGPAAVVLPAGRRSVIVVHAHRGPTPAAGVPVVARWGDGGEAATAVSDASGNAGLVLDGRRGGVLRVVAADATLTVRVDLRAGVSLVAARGAVCSGCSVLLHGRVLPARGPVRIEAYHGGVWHLVRVVPTTASGTFATRLAIRTRGLYVFRATVGGVRSRSVQVWGR